MECDTAAIRCFAIAQSRFGGINYDRSERLMNNEQDPERRIATDVDSSTTVGCNILKTFDLYCARHKIVIGFIRYLGFYY